MEKSKQLLLAAIGIVELYQKELLRLFKHSSTAAR
jgi:hypothetical protein